MKDRADEADRGITPSQTVGPFFAYGLTPAGKFAWSDLIINNLLTPDVAGERIRIEGRVTDADGKPINDALLEIWQADGEGRYASAGNSARSNTAFKGFGRTGTDQHGAFSFDTVKPGAVAGPAGEKQAPHILLAYFSRGLLTHMYTRIYFADEKSNDADPVLNLVPAERRRTLVAKRELRGTLPVYRFDIALGGDDETVFFDV
jgi:protocatechuate 3,4-dioxygenase alpha subunit